MYISGACIKPSGINSLSSILCAAMTAEWNGCNRDHVAQKA